MRPWVIIALLGATLLTAFKCSTCQKFNSPKTPETASVIEAIRYTPVSDTTDSIFVMPIRKGLSYFKPVYDDIVKCSRLSADKEYESLTFYVTDTPEVDINGTRAIAYYEPESHSVILTLGHAFDKKAVGHELLHMLLQANGLQDPRNKDEDQHPGYWFNDDRKCKGLVYPH